MIIKLSFTDESMTRLGSFDEQSLFSFLSDGRISDVDIPCLKFVFQFGQQNTSTTVNTMIIINNNNSIISIYQISG